MRLVGSLCLVLALVGCGEGDGEVDGGPQLSVPDAGGSDSDAGDLTDAGPDLGLRLETVGDLNEPREGHTATLLASGRVLIAGGQLVRGGRMPIASIEEFDPSTDTFSEVGSLPSGRAHLSATRLADDRVLIVGGCRSSSNGLPMSEVSDSVSLYDPETQEVSDAASLAYARCAHGAVLLPDGRVLVVGGTGSTGAPLGDAEVYDPDTDSWSEAGTLAAARTMLAIELDVDGHPLILGGGAVGFSPVATVERWVDGSFEDAGELPGGGRIFHASARLASGEIVVTGGLGVGFSDAVDRLAPGASEFEAAEPLPSARNAMSLISTEGRLVAIGGFLYDGSAGEVFGDVLQLDPTGGAHAELGLLPVGRASATATVLEDGDILLVGGYSQTIEVIAPALRIRLGAP